MFKEYVVVYGNPDGESTSEIMLHFNENGKLLRMYCYTDNPPLIEKYSETKGEYYIARKIKPCENKLFSDLSLKLFPVLSLNMYLCMEDEEFNTDDIIQKAVMNYKNFQFI